jgi:hypothetical protein
MTATYLATRGPGAASVSRLYAVSSTGTSLYVFDKDQGVGLSVLQLTTKVERLAAPSQV